MVEFVERVGVVLRTAHNLYERGSDAELRAAMILLDSAAEMVLYSAVKDVTAFWPYRETLNVIAEERGDSVENITLPAAAKMEELPDGHLWRMSKKTMGKVERDFSKKLELLEFTGHIPTVYRQTLSRLHEYRNAAYHRDTLREETLRTSVELHFWLTAQLLRLKPGMHLMLWGDDVHRIAALLDLPEEVVKGSEPAIRDALADWAETSFSLEALGVQGVLANNLLARLDELDGNIDFGLEVWGRRDMTREDLFRLMQEDELLVPLEELRKRTYPVDENTIERWRGLAEVVRETPAALVAFAIYGEIEVAMSKFEEEAVRLALAADEEVQRQIDYIRGK